MDKMQIYNALPVWAQNCACYYEGRKIVKTRYGNYFWEKLSEYEERSSWSYERKCEYRDSQLGKLILHAYKTVPYYKRIIDESGKDPSSFNYIDDLKKLPILTKDNIKKEPMNFISSEYVDKKLVTSHTSGTTGNGFVFKVTQEALCEQWAVWWRYRRILGISFDDVCALFGGRSIVPIKQKKPPYYRYNRPCKQLYFSTYHMNEDSLKYYIDSIKKNDINWIHGYPSAINILADYMIQNGIKAEIEFVTTGAENLLESQKDKMIRAFGNEPYQHYGLSEGTANFSENKEHIMMVDEDYAAVEFLDNGNGAKAIIGTNLTNFAMPFIRYNTGDICETKELDEGRIVTAIDGRKEDYLVLADGTKIGRLDHIFKDMVNVKEAQFVQRQPGEVKLRIVRGANFNDDDEKILKQEIFSRLKGIDLNIDYVDKIERTKSGKFRFVISE